MKKNRSAKKPMKKVIKTLAEQKKPINYVLLGFLIPFLGMCLTLLIRSIIFESNGSSVFSLLHSDSFHQYYPFFVSYRETLRTGGSLLWTWDVGTGMDFWALIAYYLGSPLNFLSIFVPDAWLADYYTFLTPVRIGLASLFFTLMLNKLYGKNDLSIALFGAFYGTCAWAFGYLWNTMWMDTFALLPLVVLGTVQLLKDRKFILYTISLFLSVAINYYVGFFTCIFTLLVFICYQVCRWQSFKRFWIDLSLMALFTVIAIGMTAFISLPTLASLQTTSAAANEFPSTFDLNISEENTFLGLLDAMKQVATNTFIGTIPNSLASEGLPNIYSGTFANIFIFLFLTCKHIKWRDRICGLLMLLFINASFCIRQLDYIWHGFHFTNMIPYRFSFLYSFVMLYMAYRAWLLRRRMRTWQVIVAGVLTFVMMLASNNTALLVDVISNPAFQATFKQVISGSASIGALRSFVSNDLTYEAIMPFVNGILILIYLAALLCMTLRVPTRKNAPKELKLRRFAKFRARRAFGGIFLVCVLAAELVLNIALYGVYCRAVDLGAYPKGKSDMARIVSIMKEREDDNLFYRAETSRIQTYNDGALNNYYGITTFSSSVNKNTTSFMNAMGLAAHPTWNRFAYETTSPILNMFTNLKYLIERHNGPTNDTYWSTIHSSGKVHLMENQFYLPLGFMVDPALAEISIDDPGNRSTFQNNFLSAAIGNTVYPWSSIQDEDLSISSTDSVKLTSVSGSGTCNYSASASGSLFFTFDIQESGYFCVRFNLPKRNNITISYDDGSGYRTIYTKNPSLSFTIACGDVKPGDRIQVTLKCKANESGLVQVFGTLLNKQIMETAHKQLSQSPLELTKFSDTMVEGTVECKKDGLLYTSIPQQDDNWHVYVDGKETEATLICDTMMGVMLKEGTHTVTFRYINNEFITGVVISLLSAALFGGIIWLQYWYLPKRSGKFSKKTK